MVTRFIFSGAENWIGSKGGSHGETIGWRGFCIAERLWQNATTLLSRNEKHSIRLKRQQLEDKGSGDFGSSILHKGFDFVTESKKKQ